MLHTHYFRRVRCPKCNEITDRNSTDRTFTVFGSPYQVCKYCGAPYYDPGYSEMAIDAFESKGKMLGFPGIFALLVYNGLAGYIVFSGLLKDARMWVVFLMALPVSLWYDYKLIETIRNRIHLG